MKLSRRTFLSAAAGAALAMRAPAEGFRPQLLVFSKHMAQFDYEALGRNAKDFGFDGVDLTVRPKGHVLPERVAEDLPRAVEILRKHGLTVPMITTGLTSDADPAAAATLRTAAALGIPFFGPGEWRYGPGAIETQLEGARTQMRGLAKLAAEYKITMGFHNHSGNYIGEAVWDAWEMLRDLDPQWTGFYYDAGHAAIEGGLGGHEVSLRLALPRLKMVAVKDFVWERAGTGWKPAWCSMGQGAVDWKAFFGALKRASYNGPISLHQEYNVPDMLSALRKDLAFLRAAVEQA